MGYAIEVDNLAKQYGATEQPALAGVSFEVGQGRICALLGENGSGKTTTIKILTTLLRASGGSARVAGHDVQAEGSAVRAKVGLVGQYAAIDQQLTGRQNLVMFGRLNGLDGATAAHRTNELLRRYRLIEAADRPASCYSGGMRRRLDLAAGLIVDPEVLFVDEPTTGLDPQARRDMWGAVRELADRGVSVLLTTQYLEEADALADDVVILRDGAVALAGTPSDLKKVVGKPQMVLREPSLEDVYLHLYGQKERA